MNWFLTLTFLFSAGALFGWGLEVLFRRFLSRANPQPKWINPGALTGPYLPLYGFGLCLLFLLASLEQYSLIEDPVFNKLALFLSMAFCMTLIEYIAGIGCLKWGNLRLWDYSGEWGNIKGIICPKYSAAWAMLGAIYYFFVHPYILDALRWLSQNLAFSFGIGVFYGVFLVDVRHTLQIMSKIKAFAADHSVVVAYEELKNHIREIQEKGRKNWFWHPIRSDRSLAEHLKTMLEELEHRRKK